MDLHGVTRVLFKGQDIHGLWHGNTFHWPDPWYDRWWDSYLPVLLGDTWIDIWQDAWSSE